MNLALYGFAVLLVCLQGCADPAAGDKLPETVAADGVAVATSADQYVLSVETLATRIAAANAGDADAARAVADHFGEGLQNRPADATLWALRAASLGDPKYLFVSGSMNFDAGLCGEAEHPVKFLAAMGDAQWSPQMKETLAEVAADARHPCREMAKSHLAGGTSAR